MPAEAHRGEMGAFAYMSIFVERNASKSMGLVPLRLFARPWNALHKSAVLPNLNGLMFGFRIEKGCTVHKDFGIVRTFQDLYRLYALATHKEASIGCH